jgi:copper chaperone
MESTIIKIAGMSCAGCVKSVTEVLRRQPGVVSAAVSLERGEAEVQYEPAEASLRSLMGAVDDAGFAAS